MPIIARKAILQSIQVWFAALMTDKVYVWRINLADHSTQSTPVAQQIRDFVSFSDFCLIWLLSLQPFFLSENANNIQNHERPADKIGKDS
jgi:hypothetical protein